MSPFDVERSAEVTAAARRDATSRRYFVMTVVKLPRIGGRANGYSVRSVCRRRTNCGIPATKKRRSRTDPDVREEAVDLLLSRRPKIGLDAGCEAPRMFESVKFHYWQSIHGCRFVIFLTLYFRYSQASKYTGPASPRWISESGRWRRPRQACKVTSLHGNIWNSKCRG